MKNRWIILNIFGFLEVTQFKYLCMHPGSTKMYQNLKTSYWWSGMKIDVSEFLTKCMVYQKVKAAHQVPSGIVTAYQDTRMEMGPNHNGFCGRVTVDKKKA